MNHISKSERIQVYQPSRMTLLTALVSPPTDQRYDTRVAHRPMLTIPRRSTVSFIKSEQLSSVLANEFLTRHLKYKTISIIQALVHMTRSQNSVLMIRKLNTHLQVKIWETVWFQKNPSNLLLAIRQKLTFRYKVEQRETFRYKVDSFIYW